MERKITVKPTTFRGVQMRSKTEATVAAWFEQQGWEWIYEPESLLDGIQYTPDFYLPQIDTLVEVKPVLFMKEVERAIPIVEKLKKTFAVISVGHANTVVVVDLFGLLDPCDPFNHGEKEFWGWHSEAPDEDQRTIYVDDNQQRFPMNYIYMGAGCNLRWKFGRECPCTN
ncbi:hypothetical protein [Sulfuriroseicoccus oceanibius]|uniref:Uncharacterized protein n=1 Tax=Sulfuriroseicoccus oceanibius TaxID=2707525 RepID=A0A6B3L860_9BACT|nr:hypothetical protein [Sulfuriroseicoccus oceanibius]QQL44088.1 hypothetical protein G3M56_009295 [Sulfuriroseicoccus oceanibius]